MPTYSVGPGVKHAIIWLSMISMLLLGFWFGWNSRGSWGLQTELATHIQDSEVATEIYETLFNEKVKLSKKVENIDASKLSDCARMPISSFLRPAKKSDQE